MADNPVHDRAAPIGSTTAAAGRRLDIVMVGAGDRAAAWIEPLQRSRRLRLIATVARAAHSLAPDLPRYTALEEALRRHPDAAFAVALPPRAALETALLLAANGRSGVVEAPLHDAIADTHFGPGANDVRVAHGWVTLPGLQTIARVVRHAATGRLRIEVAGLPDIEDGDLAEVLVHAAALVHALLPDAAPSALRRINGGMLEIDLGSPTSGWSAQLRLATRGRRLAVHAAAAQHEAHWSWEHDREILQLAGQPPPASRPTAPAPVRALAQLLADSARGDGLADAAAAARLARGCLSMLPTRLALGERAFRQSASIARRRPTAVLERFGLRGELLPDGPVASTLATALPPEPFEVWAFRAGIKPVAFLTVRPDDVERTLAFFGDIAVERRDRGVDIAEQDRWIDRRDRGDRRVELYIARDAELARHAASLQAEEDPTRAVRELGALLGYPACCVEAFAQQDDRANNSRNRYHSHARTFAPDGSTRAPWPWELNNLHTVLAPFYPCSYRCEHAQTWVRVVLDELGRAHPASVDELRAVLARPVLYFDHQHQIVFDGRVVDGAITYRAVALAAPPSASLATLAAAIGRGDRLSLDDRWLLVERGPQAVLRLERTDPALGFVAPFGIGQP